jgi:predicted nucleic acid-binding protein
MNGMRPLLSGYRSAYGPQSLPFPTGYKRQQKKKQKKKEEEEEEEEKNMTLKWMILSKMKGSLKKKYPNTFRKSLAMIKNKNTKMKVIMPYVTWRVVGKNSRRKKQRI